jgi:hypothetical protein
MINPKIKKYLLRFFFFGIFMALFWWTTDVSEGKSFNLVKFLTRILIFGGVFALLMALIDPYTEKKKN